jgi:hypothetical protein
MKAAIRYSKLRAIDPESRRAFEGLIITLFGAAVICVVLAIAWKIFA